MKTTILLSIAACVLAAAERPRLLILTGHSDPAHDWRTTTPVLARTLEGSGRFTVSVSEAKSFAASDLARYDLLVLHYNGPRWPAEAERAVEEFVASGKGLLSLHGVTYGPLYGQRMVEGGRWVQEDGGWTAYPKLIGATWDLAKIGHGKRHVFPVKWTDPNHPVAKGLGPEFAADDELYHRLTLLPDTRVLATAYSAPETGGTGNHEPIVWTAPFGKGRTVHFTLGHDVRALEQPGVAAAIVHAAVWLTAKD